MFIKSLSDFNYKKKDGQQDEQPPLPLSLSFWLTEHK